MDVSVRWNGTRDEELQTSHLLSMTRCMLWALGHPERRKNRIYLLSMTRCVYWSTHSAIHDDGLWGALLLPKTRSIEAIMHPTIIVPESWGVLHAYKIQSPSLTWKTHSNERERRNRNLGKVVSDRKHPEGEESTNDDYDSCISFHILLFMFKITWVVKLLGLDHVDKPLCDYMNYVIYWSIWI